MSITGFFSYFSANTRDVPGEFCYRGSFFSRNRFFCTENFFFFFFIKFHTAVFARPCSRTPCLSDSFSGVCLHSACLMISGCVGVQVSLAVFIVSLSINPNPFFQNRILDLTFSTAPPSVQRTPPKNVALLLFVWFSDTVPSPLSTYLFFPVCRFPNF